MEINEVEQTYGRCAAWSAHKTKRATKHSKSEEVTQ